MIEVKLVAKIASLETFETFSFRTSYLGNSLRLKYLNHVVNLQQICIISIFINTNCIPNWNELNQL